MINSSELAAINQQLQHQLAELSREHERLWERQRQLDREARHYRDLFTYAPDGYLVTNARGIILEANQTISDQLCVSPDRLVGQPLLDFVVQPNPAQFYAHLNQLLSQPLGQSWEILLLPRHNAPFLAELSVAQSKTALTSEIHLHWLIRDIRDRKAEANQRALIARLKAIIDHAPIAIYLKDLQGRYSLVNPTFLQLLNLTETDCIGKTDSDLLTSEIADLREKHDRTLIETGQPQRYEEELSIAKKRHTLMTVKFPLLNLKGNLEGICGISTEISDYKTAEAELIASEQRFQQIASSSPGLIYILIQRNDGSVYFEYASSAVEEIHEVTFEQIRDQTHLLIEQIHPDDLAHYGAAVAASHETLQLFRHSWRNITPSGKTKWLQATSRPERRPNGDVAWYGVVLDISDRKQAEAQLQATNEQLAISNAELARATRLKDEFLANMSHELRTPLNAILGLSEGLKEKVFGSINERQAKAIATIARSGHHLLDLINDILDLAKIESGQLELERVEVSVKSLCENSLIVVNQMAFSKNIRLETRILDQIGSLWVDERRIRQALINLLSNAVKFTPVGGRIILEMRLESENAFSGASHIAFSVIDTGIGISPEDFSKLFQPFMQIDSSLSRQQMGTGLGLSLVQRIVTQHGGTINVDSKVGQGSCFTIRLPYLNRADSLPALSKLSPAHPLPLDSDPTQMSANPLTAPLILLADDNEANTHSTASYLRAKGYRLILAKNGWEAIELAQKQKPDLILMDIQMPGMDGLEATRLIRADSGVGNIPIIALTALAMPGDRERCLTAGVTDYLAKPISLRLLISTIQQYLTKQ